MACAAHPDTEAFHECTRCGLWHCEACLKPIPTPGRSEPILACPRCDGLVRVAMVRVAPPRDDVLDLVRRPFAGEGLLTMLALAVPCALTVVPVGFFQLFMTFLWLGCLSAYYFQTVDHVGRGLAGLPFSAEPVTRSQAARALGRGLLCFGVAFGPMIFSLAALPGERALAILLGVYGIACAPAAILSVAITRSALNGIWPLMWARLIARAPAAYLRLVGLFAASSVAIFILSGVLVPLLARIPVVGPLLAAMVVGPLVIAQAALIGGFLRRNADAIGYA
jgi:hypothetical protein